MKTTYYLTKEDMQKLNDGEAVVLDCKPYKMAPLPFRYLENVIQIKMEEVADE